MISKNLQILALQPRSFSQSLEHFFLTVGQNNFGNKIQLIGALLIYITTVDSGFKNLVGRVNAEIHTTFLNSQYDGEKN